MGIQNTATTVASVKQQKISFVQDGNITRVYDTHLYTGKGILGLFGGAFKFYGILILAMWIYAEVTYIRSGGVGYFDVSPSACIMTMIARGNRSC